MTNRVHQGHLARKRFGQNFLNDQFVIESIVSAINPQKGQAMVEIGPGLAALTEPVGERLDEVRLSLAVRAHEDRGALWPHACKRTRSSGRS